MKETLSAFLYRHRHCAILSYFIVYLAWFCYLERTVRPTYWIHSWLDDLIPFQELFVIPYLFWFFYVGIAIAFFLRHSTAEYYRLCAFLFTGMTVCLTIYTFFPNGHHLRPWSFPRMNVFSELVRVIYSLDSCTNVDPSIHVLNSLGVHIAVWRSEVLKDKKWVRYGSLIACILICMSTVFLKQHSVEDVAAACVVAVPLYWMAYRFDWSPVLERLRSAHRERRERIKAE